jgi:hypothetical protein
MARSTRQRRGIINSSDDIDDGGKRVASSRPCDVSWRSRPIKGRLVTGGVGVVVSRRDDAVRPRDSGGSVGESAVARSADPGIALAAAVAHDRPGGEHLGAAAGAVDSAFVAAAWPRGVGGEHQPGAGVDRDPHGGRLPEHPGQAHRRSCPAVASPPLVSKAQRSRRCAKEHPSARPVKTSHWTS